MVSPATVRLWASRGELQSETTPGGHRRFMWQEIERFAREKGLTLRVPDDGIQRVLIVDDNKPLATSLARLLDTRSIATMIANDGFSAGRMVRDFRPHVVLLDLLMPGLDGFEVCAQIKADPASRSIRVIAMTGYCTAENVRKALSAGAESCIAKPIDHAELLHCLGLAEMRAQT